MPDCTIGLRMSDDVCSGLIAGAVPVPRSTAALVADHSGWSCPTSAPVTPDSQWSSGGCAASVASPAVASRSAAATSAWTSASFSPGGNPSAQESCTAGGTRDARPSPSARMSPTSRLVDRPIAASSTG